MAGRPRMPEAAARASGAWVKNPKRAEGRKEPKVKALGPAPGYLSPAEAEAWNMFAEEIPWLGAPDRALIVQACRLRARLIENTLPLSAFGELRQVLSQMGATPAARSKVQASPDEDGGDPLDGFVN